MPHRSAPVILIVIALARQLDPLHGSTAAGEREEHLRGALRIERPEGMTGARGGFLGRCGPVGGGISGAIGLGALRGLVRRAECSLNAGLLLRGGERQFGIPWLGRWAGEEPDLEELTAKNDREGDESELNVTAFHDLLGRFTAHRAPRREPLRP